MNKKDFISGSRKRIFSGGSILMRSYQAFSEGGEDGNTEREEGVVLILATSSEDKPLTRIWGECLKKERISSMN